MGPFSYLVSIAPYAVWSDGFVFGVVFFWLGSFDASLTLLIPIVCTSIFSLGFLSSFLRFVSLLGVSRSLCSQVGVSLSVFWFFPRWVCHLVVGSLWVVSSCLFSVYFIRALKGKRGNSRFFLMFLICWYP